MAATGRAATPPLRAEEAQQAENGPAAGHDLVPAHRLQPATLLRREQLPPLVLGLENLSPEARATQSTIKYNTNHPKHQEIQ